MHFICMDIYFQPLPPPFSRSVKYASARLFLACDGQGWNIIHRYCMKAMRILLQAGYPSGKYRVD